MNRNKTVNQKAAKMQEQLEVALTHRHHDLVGKKHLAGKLTPLEFKELTAICRLMDVREQPYYGETIKKLRRILKARAR